MQYRATKVEFEKKDGSYFNPTMLHTVAHFEAYINQERNWVPNHIVRIDFTEKLP